MTPLSQRETGKAFEYSLLIKLYELLSHKQDVKIVEDRSFDIALECFNKCSDKEQHKYKRASESAIKHLMLLEPRLTNPLSKNDALELQLISDKAGIVGDTRDILAIRKKHQWEIGISAKNQHRALKHSRLSGRIDFGKKWLGIPCSSEYITKVKEIFDALRPLSKSKTLWSSLPKKHEIYQKVLNAFRNELLKIDRKNPSIVPERLLHYLIGKQDFYKVIKENRLTLIQAFNFNGTLNKPANEIRPSIHVGKLQFPTRIIEFRYKNNSTNTLHLTFDKGWQISFRIHSASSRVETSLKFDINIIGHPQSLYSHRVSWS